MHGPPPTHPQSSTPQDLAKNRGDSQRKSKADRRELRSTFRGLVDVVEGDGGVAAQKARARAAATAECSQSTAPGDRQALRLCSLHLPHVCVRLHCLVSRPKRVPPPPL